MVAAGVMPWTSMAAAAHATATRESSATAAHRPPSPTTAANTGLPSRHPTRPRPRCVLRKATTAAAGVMPRTSVTATVPAAVHATATREPSGRGSAETAAATATAKTTSCRAEETEVVDPRRRPARMAVCPRCAAETEAAYTRRRPATATSRRREASTSRRRGRTRRRRRRLRARGAGQWLLPRGGTADVGTGPARAAAMADWAGGEAGLRCYTAVQHTEGRAQSRATDGRGGVRCLGTCPLRAATGAAAVWLLTSCHRLRRPRP
jgi:hypothetical protein